MFCFQSNKLRKIYMKGYIKTQILRYVSGCLLARETYCTKNTLCTAPSPPQRKSDVLETDYINMEDGDFVFAGEEKVPHHRIILSAASPAFNIQGHGAEKAQGGHWGQGQHRVFSGCETERRRWLKYSLLMTGCVVSTSVRVSNKSSSRAMMLLNRPFAQNRPPPTPRWHVLLPKVAETLLSSPSNISLAVFSEGWGKAGRNAFNKVCSTYSVLVICTISDWTGIILQKYRLAIDYPASPKCRAVVVNDWSGLVLDSNKERTMLK